MRAERAETAAAQRRRELGERYPDVSAQAWANMGDGLLGGEGARVLRRWLATIESTIRHCE